jgi:hypothetical protein
LLGLLLVAWFSRGDFARVYRPGLFGESVTEISWFELLCEVVTVAWWAGGRLLTRGRSGVLVLVGFGVDLVLWV